MHSSITNAYEQVWTYMNGETWGNCIKVCLAWGCGWYRHRKCRSQIRHLRYRPILYKEDGQMKSTVPMTGYSVLLCKLLLRILNWDTRDDNVCMCPSWGTQLPIGPIIPTDPSFALVGRVPVSGLAPACARQHVMRRSCFITYTDLTAHNTTHDKHVESKGVSCRMRDWAATCAGSHGPQATRRQALCD